MKQLLLIIFFFQALTGRGQDVFDVDLEERNNSVLIINTAQKMISSGKYDKAANILESVLKKDPTFHAAYVNYYNAVRNLPQKTQNLIQSLTTALDIFVEDDELAYYLGNVYQAQKQYKRALDAYSAAISFSKINGEDFPIVWAYHFNRGNCHLKTKQFENAIVDYTYALKLSPDNTDILTNRGTSYYQAKNTNKACQDWNVARRLGSKSVDKYLSNFCK